jgi:hypothetical protein
MFVPTFNFNFNFPNCFCCFKKEKYDLNNFIQSLKGHSTETKMIMLLEKITNGINDISILYTINENNLNFMTFYGYYNINKINKLNVCTIPIFVNSICKYLLIVGSYKKKVKINNCLIDILKDNLI